MISKSGSIVHDRDQYLGVSEQRHVKLLLKLREQMTTTIDALPRDESPRAASARSTSSARQKRRHVQTTASFGGILPFSVQSTSHKQFFGLAGTALAPSAVETPSRFSSALTNKKSSSSRPVSAMSTATCGSCASAQSLALRPPSAASYYQSAPFAASRAMSASGNAVHRVTAAGARTRPMSLPRPRQGQRPAKPAPWTVEVFGKHPNFEGSGVAPEIILIRSVQ